MLATALALAAWSVALAGVMAPFTPGNLVVIIGATGSQSRVQELTPTGGLVQSAILPPWPLGCIWGTAGDGSMSPDGFVSASPDGSAICFTCGLTMAVLRWDGSLTYTTVAGLVGSSGAAEMRFELAVEIAFSLPPRV